MVRAWLPRCRQAFRLGSRQPPFPLGCDRRYFQCPPLRFLRPVAAGRLWIQNQTGSSKSRPRADPNVRGDHGGRDGHGGGDCSIRDSSIRSGRNSLHNPNNPNKDNNRSHTMGRRCPTPGRPNPSRFPTRDRNSPKPRRTPPPASQPEPVTGRGEPPPEIIHPQSAQPVELQTAPVQEVKLRGASPAQDQPASGTSKGRTTPAKTPRLYGA